MKSYKKSPSDLLFELKRAQSNYEKLITVTETLDSFLDVFLFDHQGKAQKAFGMSDEEMEQVQTVYDMLLDKQSNCQESARQFSLKLIAA